MRPSLTQIVPRAAPLGDLSLRPLFQEVCRTLKRVRVSYLMASLTACWMTYFWTSTGPFTCWRSLAIGLKSEGEKKGDGASWMLVRRHCLLPPTRLLLTPPGFPDFLDDATPQLCLASVERGDENGSVRSWAGLGALQVLLWAQSLEAVGLFKQLLVQVDFLQALPGCVDALLLSCGPQPGRLLRAQRR